MENVKAVSVDEYSNSLSQKELLEMANLDSDITGIDKIVIWVGPNPPQHSRRIKISNIPNKISDTDLFTLTIPDFELIGEINPKLITSEVLEQIKNWVLLNLDAINEYSDYKMSTNKFIEALKK